MNNELLKEKILKQGGRVFDREIISGETNYEKTFAICVKADENVLIPLKVYEVTLSKTDYVGIISENGEKFIYPSDYFVLLDLSPKASQILKRVTALS